MNETEVEEKCSTWKHFMANNNVDEALRTTNESSL
ncbi:hypothetical protein EV199_3735 [Pseudobacter ginsenosidimutans]|uniref:Uncharacterized protein n=1 Tax=Pseudobacter ginsenosidimutans TaxID=661488 RepID=A0A4Q7MSM8_9BACT|nr:hypothetical protein EV199_3735 [Pseudobacter ginsenosidimutans]